MTPPPRLIPPSGVFYVFGSPGKATSLPDRLSDPGVLIYGTTLTRALDMLTLQVTVYANTAGDGFVTFDFPPQHIVESPQNTPPPEPVPDPWAGWNYDYTSAGPGALVWPAPSAQGELYLSEDIASTGVTNPVYFRTWWADIAFTGGTQLCFYTPTGAAGLLSAVEAGDLTALLDWSGWQLCLSPWGLSAASFASAPLAAAASSPGSQAEAEVASTLAMIFGLVLTQTDKGGWTHIDQPLALQGRVELWHTRLVATQQGVDPSLRAVWSLPQAIAATQPDGLYTLPIWDALPSSGEPGNPVNAYQPDTALTTATKDQSPGNAGGGLSPGVDQRTALVEATSALGNPATVEMPASDMLLSAFGGSLVTGATTETVVFHHHQRLGRDLADGAQVSSRLLPFGHPVVIANHRVREVDANGFASLRRWVTVRVLDPVVRLPKAGLKQPFSEVRLITTVIPSFTDASAPPPFVLDYIALDYAGQAIRLQAQLTLDVAGAAPPPYPVSANQQRIAFGAPVMPQGARLAPAVVVPQTTSLITDLLNLDADGDGGYQVLTAQVQHAAVSQYRTDTPTGAAVSLLVSPPDVPAGLTPDSIDALARITGPLPLLSAATAAGAINTARFGAFAAPSLMPAFLSKTFGAAGSTLDTLKSNAVDVQQSAQQAIADLLSHTKLFGLFSLQELLGSALGALGPSADDAQAWLAANGPQVTEQSTGTTKTVTLTLNATPPAGGAPFTAKLPPIGFITATFSAATIGFGSTITTDLADPANSITSATGALGAPVIHIDIADGRPADAPDQTGVQILFDNIVFTSASHAKPSFSTDFKSFAFTGDIAFLNAIMAVLPSSLFSNPPQFDIDDTHASVSCSLALPSFGFGVFDFKNVGLTTDAIIRFDPSAATNGDTDNSPLAFDFDFGTPDAPFSCAVTLLEGQGSFGMTVTNAGLDIDCSIAFGGAFEIDLVVVSGGVSITAGLHLTKSPSVFDVSGFVHVSGSVEVVGLVGLSLDAMLGLTYDIMDRVFTGYVDVTLGVSLLFFHESVGFRISKSFSIDSVLPSARVAANDDGPPSPFLPRPSPVEGYVQAWDAYCAGFAA